MNTVIKTALALAVISASPVLNAAEHDPHAEFAEHMEITSQMLCHITIKPSIINGTPFDNPDLSANEKITNLANTYDWSGIPPFELYKGQCTISNSMDFLHGEAAIIQALPSNENITDKEYYFFYLRRNEDSPKITYSISWNGYLKFTHAQWFVTEEATLNLQSNGFYCIEDEKIEMCLR